MFWSTGVARRWLMLLAVAAGAVILWAKRRGEVWHVASDEPIVDEGP